MKNIAIMKNITSGSKSQFVNRKPLARPCQSSIVILLLFFSATAWGQETLTIYESSTSASSNVPVHGLWADAYLKCEYIIPAAQLEDMVGGTISKMTFYVSSPASAAWTGTFKVFLEEVAETSISAYRGYGSATVVYEGALDGTGSTMDVNFTSPYEYGGGNLLVGFYQTVKGNYKSITFTGETVSGACVQGYSSSSLDAISATQRNFIPKTTFNYTLLVANFPLKIVASNPAADEMTWAQFADYVNNGRTTYEGFTVKLMADISVTTMAGTSTSNCFKGTFDGQGHTITVNYTASGSNYTAPFRYLNGTTIRNLKTAGTISTSYQFCGGLAGDCYGTNTITNCVSNVTINSTISNDGTHGGFIARIQGGTTTFNGCAFTGTMTGSSTHSCGGFVGWTEGNQTQNASVNFNNCVYKPNSNTISTSGSATFSRGRSDNTTNITATNSYYFQSFGTVQGKQAYKVTGVSGTTVAMGGNKTASYDVSHIDVYSAGIVFNGTVYGGSAETLSLKLGTSAGGAVSGYSASAGTLSGTATTGTNDAYTLTMPSANVEISASLCEAITVTDGSPYTDNFDSYSGNATSTSAPTVYPSHTMPSCWTFVNMSENTSNYPQMFLTTNSGYPVSGNCLFFKSSNTTPAYAVLPAFTNNIEDLVLKFTYRNEGTSSSNGTLHVGISNNLSDLSNSFVELTNGSCAKTTTKTEMEFTFASKTDRTGNYYIVFKYVGGSSNNFYLSIDNVEVSLAPTCLKPTNLTVSNITASSAKLAWEAGGTETQWQYLCADYGFTPDWSGANVITSNTHSNVPSNINAGTGNDVFPNTDYDFYVRANCGGGDYSEPIMITFRTECASTSLPYTQDFESASTGSSTSAAFVDCMHRLNNGTTYFGLPYVSSSSSYNHTASGSKGLYWYNPTTTGTYGDYQVVVLPSVDVSTNAISTLQLTFWAKASSASYHPVFIVGVMSDPYDISTFEEVATINVEGTTWTEYEAVLNSYTGSGSYVAIRANRPASSWYAYVDDITLDIAPTCPKPTALTFVSSTTTTATISWTPGGSETSWQYTLDDGVSWNDFESTPTGTTTITGEITRLSANTLYAVKVRAYCSDSDQSYASREVSFRTDCGAFNIPYEYGFEDETSFYCWTPISGNVTRMTSTTNTGSYRLDFRGTTSNMIALPLFTPPTNTLRVEFYTRPESTGGNSGKFAIGYMTDINDASTFVPVQTYNSTEMSTSYEKQTVDFTNAPAGANIAMRQFDCATNYYWYVDDITIDLVSTCPRLAIANGNNLADCLDGSKEIKIVADCPSCSSVSWSATSGSTPGTISGKTYTVTPTARHNTYTATSGGCSNSISIDVMGELTASAQTIDCGASVMLSASGIDDATYNWYNNSDGLLQENSTTYTTDVLTDDATYKVNASFESGFNTIIYDNPGDYTLAIPDGVTSVLIETWGAQGGGSHDAGTLYSDRGGKGGYSKGTYTVSGGETLYICVGGRGEDGKTKSQYSSSRLSAAGGYNGGGRGARDDETSGAETGGGGGGATHVATAAPGLSNVAGYQLQNYSNNKSDILLVAGGGGGSSCQAQGGAGGGLTGGHAYWGGTDCSTSGYAWRKDSYNGQSGGGVGGSESDNGGFGKGAEDAGTTEYSNGVGGGGGGYWGGKTNASPENGRRNSGGGGSGYLNSTLASAQTIEGEQEMPNPIGGKMTGKTGNGYVKITLFGTQTCTSPVVEVPVSVTPANVTLTQLDPQSMCAGTSITLPAHPGASSTNSPEPEYDYSWNAASGLVGSSEGIQISKSGTYTYNVTATLNSNDACTVTDSKTVEVSYKTPLASEISAMGLETGNLMWTGLSTDWNASNNWMQYSGGTYTLASTPTSLSNVVIGSYSDCVSTPTLNVNADASVNTLRIASGITVSGDNTLSMDGNLVNNGTFNAPVRFNGNTTLSGSGTTRFRDITIAGTFNASSASLTVYGNWTNNGTFTANGPVVFDGASAQNIGGNNATTFNNVTFDNANGISISKEPTIDGTATFSRGVVTGDVTFGTSAKVSGASTSSHVDGIVKKNGAAKSTDFYFPTGSNGNLGKVVVTDGTATNVSVQYFSNPAGFSVNDLPRWWASASVSGFDHVSNVEYWKISSTDTITANFIAEASTDMHFNSGTAEEDKIPTNIQMAFYDNNHWTNVGGSASIGNNMLTITGAVIPASTTRGISGNYTTFGSKTASTVLPIELLSFTATCDGRSALIEWTTATERNNDYFSLERSDDAINFIEIVRVAGAGNSIEPLDYSYTDYGIHGGDNYYRLVQVDYDGTRTASEIIVANCIEPEVGEPDVQAYPNPFNDELTVVLDNFGNRAATIEVYDMLGKLIYTEKASAPQNSYETILNLSNLNNV